MITNPIDYTKWTMVLVESKVYSNHKYLWMKKCGCFYFLVDERVSWSPQTIQSSSICLIEAQFCNSVTHTRFPFDPKVQLLIHQPYVPIHNQGEDDFVVQGDNTIMRIDAAIRWFPISCSISSFICGGCEILFLQTGRVKQTSFWRSGCWRTGAH